MSCGYASADEYSLKRKHEIRWKTADFSYHCYSGDH